jgi:hypothetical protein
MPGRPGDTEPQPSGGRAAERLREFVAQRFPQGLRPEESAREEAAGTDHDAEHNEGDEAADSGEQRPH